MIDLDKLQEAWEKDSKIDIDNLHTESLKVFPSLHAKYFDLYNTIVLLRKNAEQQKRKIFDTKDISFTSVEKQTLMFILMNPFPKRKFVIRTTMEKVP